MLRFFQRYKPRHAIENHSGSKEANESDDQLENQNDLWAPVTQLADKQNTFRRIYNPEDLDTREKFQESVYFDGLDTPDKTLNLLKQLTPDNRRASTGAYTIFVRNGINKEEQKRYVPGWEEFSTDFIRNNMKTTYIYFNSLLKSGQILDAKRESEIRSYHKNFPFLASKDIFRTNDFDALFSSQEYKQCYPFVPIKKQDDSKKDKFFLHCWSYSYYCIENHKSEEARLYLSPSLENLVPLMNTLVEKHNKANLPYYFKFDNSGGRNDRLVIYTSYQNAGTTLKILSEISKEKPNLFESMNKNPLWGTINGAPKGVYFGEEPRNKDGKKESYVSIRANVFESAYNQWTEQYDPKILKAHQSTNNEELKNALLSFRNLVIANLHDKGLGTDGRSFCFNSDLK